MKRKRHYKHLKFLREVVLKKERILKFKRPKWRQIQSDYKRFLKKRVRFLFKNQMLLDAPFNITKLRLSYKRFLLSKIRFFKFYDLKVTLSSLKRLYRQSVSIYSFLIKFEYRLDVILWRLGFFNNPTVARFYISRGFVKVNSNITKSYSLVLKKGDFVQVDPTLDKFIQISKTKKTSYVNPLYVECSYNTFEIIVIEDPIENLLSLSNYMYPRFLDLPGFRNYLRLN